MTRKNRGNCKITIDEFWRQNVISIFWAKSNKRHKTRHNCAKITVQMSKIAIFFVSN